MADRQTSASRPTEIVFPHPGVPSRARTQTPSIPKPAWPRVLLLGPARGAVSGVSTHVNQLFDSALAQQFALLHFQVGSEGRKQGRLGIAWRLMTSPLVFAARLAVARPRIVHINTSLEPKSYWRDLAYLMIAKLARRKIVYQVHGGALPAEFFAGRPPLTSLLRRVLSLPDSVVLLARSEMTAYAAFEPRARLTRIANAVSIADIDLRAARYLEPKTLEIAYLGRLTMEKGVFETIEAVRLLRARGIAVRLTIAGSGAALKQIRAAIEKAHLETQVRLVGAVFGTAKQELWAATHVFAFPTSHREGLPYALLEASAAGAVPVVSAVGAIPDVVQDGVHGLFVPPHAPDALADALERLALDRALLHRLALAARARIIDQYSIARLAEEFASVYARLA